MNKYTNKMQSQGLYNLDEEYVKIKVADLTTSRLFGALNSA